jgi:hypothetical protein
VRTDPFAIISRCVSIKALPFALPAANFEENYTMNSEFLCEQRRFLAQLKEQFAMKYNP